MFSEGLGALTVVGSMEHSILAMCRWRVGLDFWCWNLLYEDRMPPHYVYQEDSSSGSFHTLWGCCSLILL